MRFGRTLIVIVNSDTTFLSHPLPSLSSPRIDSRRPVRFEPKNGDYISASTEKRQGENRVVAFIKMTQFCG